MSCDDDEVGAITALVLVALGHGGGVEVILGQEYVSAIKENCYNTENNLRIVAILLLVKPVSIEITGAPWNSEFKTPLLPADMGQPMLYKVATLAYHTVSLV